MSNSYINRFNITQLHKYRIIVIDGYFAILFFNPLLSFISYSTMPYFLWSRVRNARYIRFISCCMAVVLLASLLLFETRVLFYVRTHRTYVTHTHTRYTAALKKMV